MIRTLKFFVIGAFPLGLLAVSQAAILALPRDLADEGETGGGGGLKTISAGYDASGADKLVVVLGAEHGFGNNGGNFDSVFYGTTQLIEAVQEGSGKPTLAIFYLDNPGAAADLTVNQQNHNNSNFGIYKLTGTAPGIGNVAQSITNSLSLTTTAPDSFVIAGINNAGPNGGNGAPNMTAVSPLTEDTLTDLRANPGRRWTTTSFGSATIAAPGSNSLSFSGAGGTDDLAFGAVEFLAASVAIPEPSSVALLGLGGMALLLRRRK
ncbi:MAG: PEP-CTERM sorting domain-containing protein [Akkermansiaceae bacterium]